MYREDKKLITDIQRKKDPDTNLSKYADVMMKADFEYACQKFALNYFTATEMVQDREFADDPYIFESILAVNRLTGSYVTGEKTNVSAEDLALIGSVRDTITKKMKILTAYTDAFELYEYLLNRREYEFPENMTEELEKFDQFDTEEFAEHIFQYIFAEQDKVVINARIQSVIAQLPLRMTKNKFYDIIGQTLSLYNGSERGALNEFAEMVENTALLKLPDGFETEYTGLYEAYEMLKTGDYTDLTYESYQTLSTVLDKSAAFLNDIVSDYLILIELVNDLYAMMLACGIRDRISSECKKAVNIIRIVQEASEADKEIPAESYDMLMELEGVQEEAGEYKMLLESSIYDIVSENHEDLVRLGLEDRYRTLETLDKLLSGSMFVDITNLSDYDTMPADLEYIAALKDQMVAEFAALFAKHPMVVNRGIMAKILSNIPVFFNSRQEIRDYISYSLSHCSNRSELIAACIVILEMMEEYSGDQYDNR